MSGKRAEDEDEDFKVSFDAFRQSIKPAEAAASAAQPRKPILPRGSVALTQENLEILRDIHNGLGAILWENWPEKPPEYEANKSIFDSIDIVMKFTARAQQLGFISPVEATATLQDFGETLGAIHKSYMDLATDPAVDPKLQKGLYRTGLALEGLSSLVNKACQIGQSPARAR